MFWKWRKPRAGPEPDDDLAMAQQAFADGELAQAVEHLAWALDHDPQSAQGRALLERIIRAARDPLELVAFRRPETPYAIVALRAYIHAWRGQVDQSLELLAQIYHAVPGLPFLPWLIEWLSSERLEEVQPQTMQLLLATLARKLRMSGAPDERAAIAQLLPLFERYRALQPIAAYVISTMASLVRDLGQVERGLALAEEAYRLQPDYQTAVVLGTTRRASGALEAALGAFRQALADAPDDTAVRLDLADTLCAMGRFAEGLAIYHEVFEREPGQAWASPSLLYYQAVLEPFGPCPEQLEQYARQHPDNRRAQQLSASFRPYLSFLPEPGDATINVLRQLIEQQASFERLDLELSSLESPSARLALERCQLAHYGRVQLSVKVTQLQRPDPRLPLGPVEVLLWRYQGVEPQPAVAPPAPELAAVVAQLASQPYQYEAWTYLARQSAARLGPGSLDGLLGVMVHPPAQEAPFSIWRWLQRVQYAAAFLIAQLDAGWAGSQRRRVLLSLARGPMDWTVGAAIVALWALIYQEPAAAADVARLYMELLSQLPEPGGVPYLDALLTCSFALPDPPPELRTRAGRVLKEYYRV